MNSAGGLPCRLTVCMQTEGKDRTMDTEANDIAARLAEIKESLAAITPGPWFDDSYNSIFHGPHVFIASVPDHPESAEWGDPQENDRQYDRETWFRESAANRAFIANARQDIPWLIEQLETVQGIAKQSRQEGEQCDVQLAGCSVAALGGTKDTATRGDYGWSPTYQSMLDLRQERDRLAEENRKLREALGWYAEPRTWNQWCPASFADVAVKALAAPGGRKEES